MTERGLRESTKKKTFKGYKEHEILENHYRPRNEGTRDIVKVMSSSGQIMYWQVVKLQI